MIGTTVQFTTVMLRLSLNCLFYFDPNVKYDIITPYGLAFKGKDTPKNETNPRVIVYWKEKSITVWEVYPNDCTKIDTNNNRVVVSTYNIRYVLYKKYGHYADITLIKIIKTTFFPHLIFQIDNGYILTTTNKYICHISDADI